MLKKETSLPPPVLSLQTWGVLTVNDEHSRVEGASKAGSHVAVVARDISCDIVWNSPVWNVKPHVHEPLGTIVISIEGLLQNKTLCVPQPVSDRTTGRMAWSSGPISSPKRGSEFPSKQAPPFPGDWYLQNSCTKHFQSKSSWWV